MRGLNPTELKNLALSKRQASQPTVTETIVPQELIDSKITELEGLINKATEEGNLYAEITLDNTELMYAIASQFKTTNPLLMVLTHGGEKKLTVTWDGNNYV